MEKYIEDITLWRLINRFLTYEEKYHLDYCKRKGETIFLLKTPRVHKVPYFVQRLVSKFRRNFFQEKNCTNLGENLELSKAFIFDNRGVWVRFHQAGSS